MEQLVLRLHKADVLAVNKAHVLKTTGRHLRDKCIGRDTWGTSETSGTSETPPEGAQNVTLGEVSRITPHFHGFMGYPEAIIPGSEPYLRYCHTCLQK